MSQHTWDIHIGAVDVFSGREVPSILAILSDSLLARPRLVSPREKDEEQFVDDVRVGDVEVVFESRNIDISTDLNVS